MVGLCEARLPGQAWHVADMRSLSLDWVFDGIVAWDSFFHLSPDDQGKRPTGAVGLLLDGCCGCIGCCVDVPGQQLGHAADGVVGDAAEDLSQIGFGVEAIQFGGLDEAIDGGGPLTARVRSGEQPVLPAQRHGPDRALDRIVVYRDGAVVDVAGQRGPA